MFQGNLSTSASNTERSFFDTIDVENPKTIANPLVKMPHGHDNYTEADKERCPVMTGKTKPPVEEDEEEYDSDSSEEEETALMPKGHEGYSEKDKENCPVISGKIPYPQNGQADGQTKKKKKRKVQAGCPVMPAENKKAPALAHLEPAYEVPYISTLRHLFTFKGLLPKGRTAPENRQNFDKYPIFLKHTLFHKEDTFSKVRKMEASQRFFVYDKFREQGNKKYNRKNPQEAIGYYEHALSCFKWLEIKKDDHKNFEEIKEEDPLARLKPLTRALATVLNDDNVELHDGEEITESNEIDMRNSMLLNIYLSLACAYLKLNHYSTAIVACEEGLKLSQNSSQLYFRRSQARAYNKGATLDDLYKAKDDIEKAIEVKHHEKLFQQDMGILKIMNVHNAGEIYVEHAHFVEKLIKEKKDEIKSVIKPFFSKIKELEFIEEAMKDKEDNEEEHAVEIEEKEQLEELELIREMLNKYYKIIEFNIETEKKEQIQIARTELQGVLETYTKMKLLLNLDFKNYQNNPEIQEVVKDFEIDLSNPKTQKRLEKFKLGKARDIFENSHFNMEVFQYAAKDHLKKKEEKEKKKKALKEQQDAIKPKNKWTIKIFGVEFGIHMLVLVLLFGLFWYWNQSGSFGPATKISKGK